MAEPRLQLSGVGQEALHLSAGCGVRATSLLGASPAMELSCTRRAEGIFCAALLSQWVSEDGCGVSRGPRAQALDASLASSSALRAHAPRWSIWETKGCLHERESPCPAPSPERH